MSNRVSLNITVYHKDPVVIAKMKELLDGNDSIFAQYITELDVNDTFPTKEDISDLSKWADTFAGADLSSEIFPEWVEQESPNCLFITAISKYEVPISGLDSLEAQGFNVTCRYFDPCNSEVGEYIGGMCSDYTYEGLDTLTDDVPSNLIEEFEIDAFLAD